MIDDGVDGGGAEAGSGGLRVGGVRWQPLLAALLAAVFFAQALCASLQKSAAFDEPFHLASGLLYVESGRIVRPPDHPPLLRELSGLMLHAVGIRLPQTPAVAAVLRGRGGDLEYLIGDSVIADNGPGRVMFWARLPFLLLGAVFVWTIYWMGRALVSEAAGLGAALLCALDPLLLSNFGLVYTDAGVALFGMLTVLALWHYVQRPTWLRVLWCGLALGAALGAKYSAVALAPTVALLLVAAKIWPVHKGEAAPVRSLAGNYWVAFAGMCVVAASVLLYVFLWPTDPMFYVKAMHEVNRNHDPRYLYYLGGEYAKHFYRYYVEAWLLKEPLATIVLTALGAVVLARSREVSRLACVFLLAPAGILLAGYSLYSDHLGVRYLLPVLPFTMVAAGAGLASLWRGPRRWMHVAAVLLCVWLAAASAGVYPDHMNYFNEAACLLDKPSQLGWDGGTRCGVDWLDDSNTDSGQGLKELHAWLEQHGGGRQLYVGYFGSLPAAIYGVPVRATDYATVLRGTEPGLYVVSAQIVARAHPGAGGNGAMWLLQRRPIAFVGHTYYVYEVP